MIEFFENFFGVYLLYNVSEKYRGRTYIGFTTNPNRRLSQHNKGVQSGGARKTDNKGPWKMVLIIHGFPNEISALRFEWAWQNPKKSRRLQHLPLKKSREKIYDFSIRVLTEMLQIGPWNRLPLTIRLLDDDFSEKLPDRTLLPLHMLIINEPISIQRKSPRTECETDNGIHHHRICNSCKINDDDDDLMTCVNTDCDFISHIICLSDYFLRDSNHLIPVVSHCPRCYISLNWGDLVCKMKNMINVN